MSINFTLFQRPHSYSQEDVIIRHDTCVYTCIISNMHAYMNIRVHVII